MEEWRKTKSGKFIKTAIIGGGLFLAVFLFFSPALAQAPPLNLGLEYVDYTGLANTDIRMIVVKIIRAALGLLGLVALGLTIYGGYMYMTAGGNEEKIATAKKILLNMAIGLAIILSALGIVQFIISAIYSEYEAKYGAEQPSGGPSEEFTIGGFLGSVIESHFPQRNAVDIPRNTKIVVTFKQKIKPETLIVDINNDGIYGNIKDNVSDQIYSDNIKIYSTAEKESAALGMKPETDADDVYAYLSDDGRTIVLKPKNYLGNNFNDVNYTVDLKNGVKLADGSLAFSGTGGHYSWQFTVSTEFDLTPPQVQSIFPIPKISSYPPNVIVQINFNEAVDPISASGLFKVGDSAQDFNNITIVSSMPSGNETVNGEYKITNQYKTVEFVSFDKCDENPCGQPIFCLPRSAQLTATAKAATVDTNNLPQAKIMSNLYDGVVDMAGNSLDGGGEMGKGTFMDQKGEVQPLKNGKAEGPSADNFWWSFTTSKDVKTSAPYLTKINPTVKEKSVAVTDSLTMTFNDPMSVSSFNKIFLKTNKLFNVWYTPAAKNFMVNGAEVTKPTDEIAYTQAELLHGAFWKNPAEPKTDEEKVSAVYYPFIPSAVTDIYQNCFYPAVGPGTECVADKPNGADPNKLNDSNPSCYNGEAAAGASLDVPF